MSLLDEVNRIVIQLISRGDVYMVLRLRVGSFDLKPDRYSLK